MGGRVYQYRACEIDYGSDDGEKPPSSQKMID